MGDVCCATTARTTGTWIGAAVASCTGVRTKAATGLWLGGRSAGACPGRGVLPVMPVAMVAVVRVWVETLGAEVGGAWGSSTA